MGTYSFLNITGTITGPGGNVNLAAGAAIADEGITIEHIEDKNVMTIGADGLGQHSLVASDAKTITIRTLKTSPLNAQLMVMYNTQSLSSSLWGTNQVNFQDTHRGDFFAGQNVAFKKPPTIVYAKEAGMNEWVLDCMKGDLILGSG